jgi:hypothetical protein
MVQGDITMTGKLRALLLIILVLVVPLAIAACGGDDDKDDNGGNGDSKVELSETLESDMGVTIKYPSGWVSDEPGDGTLVLANSQDALDASNPEKGQQLFIVFDPAASAMLGSGDSPQALLTSFANMMAGGDEDTKLSEAEEIKLGGKDGAQMTVSDPQSEGAFLAVDLGDGNIVLMGAAAGLGEYGDFEATALAIAGSISYAAPEGGEG